VRGIGIVCAVSLGVHQDGERIRNLAMQYGLTGVLSGALLSFSTTAQAEISATPISLRYGQYSIGFDGDNIDVHDSDFDGADLLRGLNLKFGFDDALDLRLEYDRYKYETRDEIKLYPGYIYVSLYSRFD
jgi:hypothetical protein